ncbi:hypothetical protein DNK06_20135 [Pseudomonas daroniae]|uniref:Lipoprotein n=1 Tax=Phytopseudomonas daroniae TaxID=2487519 RepID=A0A4Q9QH04_9GAMM|nr:MULTISPECIES: hypothetical protein [Pseudomonas]TBU72500.1 hypothetical protein DNK10_20690 [Pseudomonas daroniae]TBU73760.1 hypothetical protein DNK06_20135 [Pseudomonas daroniae]TBU79511.1 hypothetical protein DNK31_18965 [Pseudomonas sp. FRB 228]TBU88204.1 hypothetical protein DNJ99_19610 [Pseudomonas daroniae]
MHISRKLLVFTLLPLFASCQVYKGKPVDPEKSQTRLQGELTREADQLWFKPCQDPRRFAITEGNTSITQDSSELLGDGHSVLFADLRGRLGSTKVGGADGGLELSRVYRLQGEGHGCDDPNFKRTLLRASGQEPFWSVTVSNQGMVLSGPDHEPLALPYMEEQLPDGRINLTSEANGQRVELWIAPQRCVNDMSGAVQHLSAELRLNDQLMRGCAAFGGARND